MERCRYLWIGNYHREFPETIDSWTRRFWEYLRVAKKTIGKNSSESQKPGWELDGFCLFCSKTRIVTTTTSAASEAYAQMECPWGIGKNGKGPGVDGG